MQELNLEPFAGRFALADVVTALRAGSALDAGSAPNVDVRPLRAGCTVVICTYKRCDSLKRFLDSLVGQTELPDQLVLVDASPDAQSEAMVRAYRWDESRLAEVLYFRVRGSLAGLTRQRNFSLPWAKSDRVAFFDDDIVLRPTCLAEMERAFREGSPDTVGVGAFIENEEREPTMFWKIRRLLWMVPTLQPGGYARSGIATPWKFLRPTDSDVQGKWLTGYAMMWRTELAQHTRFYDGFSGYSSGEDLDFGLRMGRRGTMWVAGRARALHYHEQGGRPNAYELGHMSLRNAYVIHCRCLPDRKVRDVLYFLYAYGMDTILRSCLLLTPGDLRARWNFLCGRLKFFRDLLARRLPATNVPSVP